MGKSKNQRAVLTQALILETQATTDAPIVAGQVEYDGQAFYATVQEDRRAIGMTDASIVSDITVANSTTLTTLYTDEVPACGLQKGKHFVTSLAGYYSVANASDTFELTFNLGGKELDTITSIPASHTDAGWHCEFHFTIRGAQGSTAGDVVAFAEIAADEDHQIQASTAPVEVDLSVAEDITVNMAWGNALAGNTLTVTQGITRIYN